MLDDQVLEGLQPQHRAVHDDNETPQVFGQGGYFWHWAKATLENWQSEFLQLFTMVVLTAMLIHKNSAESRDSNDRMEEALKRIERKLADVEGKRRG